MMRTYSHVVKVHDEFASDFIRKFAASYPGAALVPAQGRNLPQSACGNADGPTILTIGEGLGGYPGNFK